MSTNRSRSLLPKTMAPAALAVALTAPSVSLGDPPPWAPAHGWRKKNDTDYVGYTGTRWERDYGVIDGRCNREAVGAVLGGVAGGAIGSTMGKGDGRTVAILAGTVLGAVIGAKVGRDIDEADRGCVGHALELAPDGRAVIWSNPQTGASYIVTPMRGYKADGQSCREFKTAVSVNGRKETATGRACRAGDGTWQIAG